jgi:hypothetical protein
MEENPPPVTDDEIIDSDDEPNERKQVDSSDQASASENDNDDVKNPNDDTKAIGAEKAIKKKLSKVSFVKESKTMGEFSFLVVSDDRYIFLLIDNHCTVYSVLTQSTGHHRNLEVISSS